MFEWFTFKILEILPNVQDLLKSSREFEDKNILGFLDILDSLLMILSLYVFFNQGRVLLYQHLDFHSHLFLVMI